MSAVAFFTAVALFAFFAFEAPESDTRNGAEGTVVAEQSASAEGDSWLP